ncbi:MAG: aldo/keto reductase [Trueperaceae bacterium]|nr:aldo/keto reductase [Trueperaceae bacterium]
MRTRPIGSLDASVVGLGCNNFGGRIDEAATRAVLDAALDSGITFLDTADIYGDGESERFIGRWLRAAPERRDRVVITTKFGHPRGGDDRRGHPDHVRRAIDESLQRLQSDHVDLFLLHRPDPDVPVADTLGALGELVRAGKVREIGCSDFDAEGLAEADAAVASGAPRFVCLQNEYSLLRREPEASVLPAVERLGMAFVPYFPLLSGLLSGKYRKGHPLPEGARITGSPRFEPLLDDAHLDRVEALATFAESRGRELVDLAFAWLLARASIPSVIAGATTPAQIRRNALAAQWELDPEEVRAVDAITAGFRA